MDLDLDPDSKDADLYRALMRKDETEVLGLYKTFPDGALHMLTKQGTVLHMAINTLQVNLVLKLLDELPREDFNKLITCTNSVGNTILHEAAPNGRLIPAAEKMLSLQPNLLYAKNDYGETALFRSVRYGQIEMFNFLDGQARISCPITEDRIKRFYLNKEFTILHQAIVSRQYYLALLIAQKYKFLAPKRDRYGVSGLQHLARNPLAFKHRGIRCLRSLFYSAPQIEDITDGQQRGLTTEERAIVIEHGLINEDTAQAQEGKDTTVEASPWCRMPWWDSYCRRRHTYESALDLSKFLIKTDKSWKFSNPEKEETYDYEGESSEEKKNNVVERLTPLLLAAKVGNAEIVEEILKVYPQAVEHIDPVDGTILHIAIKYGHIQIFNMVEKMEIPMARLIKKTDSKANTILHMVGEKSSHRTEKDISRSPAMQLQEDLLLFERIKRICSAQSYIEVNSKGKTAEQVFDERNNKVRVEAETWMKRTAENCSIVAILIATVAFAAAYTVPGGSEEKTGQPVLLNQPFFVIFTISDVLSLTFTLTSVIIFLSILTSSFRMKDFKRSLPQKLILGVTSLLFSVAMMMLAFAATIILMIHNKEQWTRVALYTIAFLPVLAFGFSYLPLYLSLMRTVKYIINRIQALLPQFRVPSLF